MFDEIFAAPVTDTAMLTWQKDDFFFMIITD
jgi:hypothetical protein